jgi:hypothetical protein
MKARVSRAVDELKAEAEEQHAQNPSAPPPHIGLRSVAARAGWSFSGKDKGG